MIKKYLIACVFCLGFVLFETSILSNFYSIKIIPDFVLLCTVYIAINNGKLFGTGVGFVGGMFLDFMSIGPFGLNALARTIVGYIFGLTRKSISTDGVIVSFIIGLVITFVKGIVLFIVSCLYPNLRTYDLISLHFVFEMLINAVLAPVVFKFLNTFKNILVVDISKGVL